MCASIRFLVINYFTLLLLAGTLPCAHAQDIKQISPGLFEAGVPSDEFEFFAAPEVAGKQRQSNWCWAATVQMVLNYHGIVVTQEQIVSRIFGGNPNLPAQPAQVLTALSGWGFQLNGRPANILATPLVFRGSDVVTDLALHWPLIVGLTSAAGGHAYVLTAVTYAMDSVNEPIFISAILRDPWPSNPSRIEVPWELFAQRITFVARVRVKRM